MRDEVLKEICDPVAVFFSVFLLTVGMIGLELVAIELDNLFGRDENDLDVNGE